MNKNYVIKPKCAENKVIDIYGAKTDNGTDINIYELGEGIHPYFKFIIQVIILLFSTLPLQ